MIYKVEQTRCHPILTAVLVSSIIIPIKVIFVKALSFNYVSELCSTSINEELASKIYRKSESERCIKPWWK